MSGAFGCFPTCSHLRLSSIAPDSVLNSATGGHIFDELLCSLLGAGAGCVH